MMRTAKSLTLAIAACGVLAIGCDKDRTSPMEETREQRREPMGAGDPMPMPMEHREFESPATEQRAEEQERAKGQAELKAADGQDVDGEVEFSETADGVRIVANIEKAPPGKHGLHVHQKGDCSNIKGKSMGGHFAPEGHMHSLPGESKQRHLGDLGNLDVDQEGEGKLEITIKGANLKKNDPMSLLGRAIVLHMGEDKGEAKQPAGGSGTPIACGVIEEH